MAEIGNWLSEEIKSRGWSMSELARRANVSPSQVANVVGDRSGAGADFCLGIAKALHASPVYVMELAGLIPPQPKPDDPQLQQLYRLFSQLNEAEREFVIRELKGLIDSSPPGK